MDEIYLDDGERVRKKVGKVDKIEKEMVYFLEQPSGEYMIIPTARIVRIIKDMEDGC